MGADGFDLTFPRVPLTGGERTIEELAQPDERSIGYRLDAESLQSPYLELEKRLPEAVPPKLRERIVVARQLGTYAFFCYEFHAVSLFWSVSCIEMALKFKFEETHPGPIKLKRTVKGVEEMCEVPVTEVEDRIRSRWRIPEMNNFDYSFKALLTWAFRQAILPEDIEVPVQEIVNGFNNRFAPKVFPARAQKDGLLGASPSWDQIQDCWKGLSESPRKNCQSKASTVLIEELPRFRNLMAHPRHFNLVTPPRSPLSAYQLLIDIVSRLWPSALGLDASKTAKAM